jgi:uncharacterized membrane protein YfcA
MLSYLIVYAVALAGSFLSFFSGFGLGTLLLPAFLLFFPVPLAVAAAGIVHLLNTLFKIFLVGRYADRATVLLFGIPSVAGAFAGAWLLKESGEMGIAYSYAWGDQVMQVDWINLIMASMIVVFTIFEWMPSMQEWNIPRKWFPLGGLLSGFFGGLSGHQGALRSAFLAKSGMSKEAFMGSRAVISVMVDVTRVSVYASFILTAWSDLNTGLIVGATASAFAGAWIGNYWMKKTTMKWIQNWVTGSLIVFALLLASGLV